MCIVASRSFFFFFLVEARSLILGGTSWTLKAFVCFYHGLDHSLAPDDVTVLTVNDFGFPCHVTLSKSFLNTKSELVSLSLWADLAMKCITLWYSYDAMPVFHSWCTIPPDIHSRSIYSDKDIRCGVDCDCELSDPFLPIFEDFLIGINLQTHVLKDDVVRRRIFQEDEPRRMKRSSRCRNSIHGHCESFRLSTIVNLKSIILHFFVEK